MSKNIPNKKNLILFLLFIQGLLLFFQNCTVNISQNTSNIRSNGNGSFYDGKMTFISVVPGFKCEGEFSPKEILIQENKRWFYTLNEQNKCRSINNVEVFDVEYFEDKSFLTYKDHIFYKDPVSEGNTIDIIAGSIKEFLVNPQENSNSSDVQLGDGICSNINGQCSLKAALDEANSAPTVRQIIRLPAGTYTVYNTINLTTQSFLSITGEDPLNTILINDSTNTSGILNTPSLSPGVVVIENLSLNNGSAPFGGFSGIKVNASTHIKNCILENHTGVSGVIVASPSSLHLLIENTRIRNNANSAVEIFSALSVSIHNSEINNNGINGVNVSNGSSNIKISNTTISNNNVGVTFRKCVRNCTIESSTISGNNAYGLSIEAPQNTTYYDDLIIRNTTITNNALVSGANLRLDCGAQSPRHMKLENSIISKGTSANPNCTYGSNNLTYAVFSSASIIDDISCGNNGTVLNANPMLGPLADNGGFNFTHLPLNGSPAIDSGSNLLCLSMDQRGLLRPIQKTASNPVCDIGSVEMQ